MRADQAAGGKIGPRLVDLMVHGVLAARRGLAPHEARVQTAALQQLVDRMGHEHAALIDPMMRKVIAAGEMPADLAAMIERAASGQHQWEARALASVAMGTAQSALGQAISNYLWPVAAGWIREHPNLPPDPNTLAGMNAAGWINDGTAYFYAAEQGISDFWMTAMRDMAYQRTDPAALAELQRRGLLDDGVFWQMMRLLGYHPDAIEQYQHLIRVWLSPADAATAVIRGQLSETDGQAIAAAAGLIPADFTTLMAITGEPLGLEQLQEAYRRGFIDQPTFVEGVRQSRVRDQWIPTALELRYSPMSLADAADAALRGHLTEDQAQAIAEQNGLLPEQWAPYYANQGNPPAPEQLLQLWRRKFITESDVDTGLRQGRIRDQWIPQVKDLRTQRLPTADAIDAWLRGHLTADAAREIATQNGLADEDLDAAFGNAGNPISLTDLMDALRRGYIDEQTFVTGFRESRYRDDWLGTALRLRYSPMSTADAIEAALQGYLGRDQAAGIAQQNGLLADQFGPLYDKAGNPLSATECAELFNRGLMTATEYAQALRESRLKDKYIPQAIELHRRLPQEYQILQLLKAGSVKADEATSMLEQLGYTPYVAGRFVAEGTGLGTGKHKDFAQSVVLDLYEAQMIDSEQALTDLEALGYAAADAQLVLNLADYTRTQRILNTGIASVRKVFLAYNASDLEVQADLLALGIPTSAIGQYLKVWTLERAGQVRTLTEAQIVKAHTLGLFNTTGDPAGDAAATTRLTQLGYSPGDAQLLLNGA